MEHRGDPGAVQYGNFMNYYQFNSASERVKLLPAKEIWDPSANDDTKDVNKKPYLVLDVGCNSGFFTRLLHGFLEEQLKRPVYILGVDIDERLVERAKAENTVEDKISYSRADILNENDFKTIFNYLRQHQHDKFDAICCYSITMWIHLNHHDEGLQQFLRTLSQLARLFVVEPQPWKCYQTAERRLKKAGEVFPLFCSSNGVPMWSNKLKCIWNRPWIDEKYSNQLPQNGKDASAFIGDQEYNDSSKM